MLTSLTLNPWCKGTLTPCIAFLHSLCLLVSFHITNTFPHLCCPPSTRRLASSIFHGEIEASGREGSLPHHQVSFTTSLRSRQCSGSLRTSPCPHLRHPSPWAVLSVPSYSLKVAVPADLPSLLCC